MSPHRPRVVIVDDSAFMRKMISEMVESSGEFTVVGTARNGADGLCVIDEKNPDIVTLDIEMPEMDGLTALERIMSTKPRAVVMLSAAGSGKGTDMTIRALELGAVEFVRKPSGPISLDLVKVKDQLIGALRAAAASKAHHFKRTPRRPTTPPHAKAKKVSGICDSVIVFSSSTGGPRALSEIIPQLEPDIGAAVLIVQHMPRDFTRSLAERLNLVSALPVAEAKDSELISANRVYLAPGGVHMLVAKSAHGPVVRLENTPPLWGVRPAADILLNAVASVFGARAIGVILTGMGHDGALGLQALRAAGGVGIVQDEATSLIYGMPKAALAAGGAEHVLATGDIAPMLARIVTQRAEEST